MFLICLFVRDFLFEWIRTFPFLLSGQRGRCGAERISIISQEERECLLSDSAAESVNTKWRSELEIDKCLALFWHWASGTGQALLRRSETQHYTTSAFLANGSEDEPEEATWGSTKFKRLPLFWHRASGWAATSSLTSWRMTWEHCRPACSAALTNDFDATEDKMFGVWRLKQFICFIDLQYKGKEIIEH